MKKNILSLAMLLIVSSCSNQNQPDPIVVKEAEPLKLSATQTLRVSQDNDFAFNLLRKVTQLNSDEKNLFISPLSVSLALGMLRNGATDETLTEINHVIGLDQLTSDSINNYFKLLQSSLPHIDPLTKMSIANSIWYKKDFSAKNDFMQTNANYFGAYIKSLDFTQSYAKDTINNWCAKHTNNLIPKIIDRIPSNAVMYLTNAIYFKGTWRQKFDKSLTANSRFENADLTVTTVKMMNRQGDFAYTTDSLAQYLDLPYGNNAYSMTVVLPLETQQVATVLSSLTAEKWTSVQKNLYSRQVKVSLPRFRSESSLELNETLKALGMSRAFTTSAQFGKISNEGLMVSEVVHKTYINVDEEGTEAAAVTNIGMVTTAYPEFTVFNANRPFLYLIRERSTGIIVFCGIINQL